MFAAVAAKQNVGKCFCVKEAFASKVIVPRLHVRVDARGVEARVDGFKQTFRVLDDVETPPEGRETAVDAADDQMSHAKADEGVYLVHIVGTGDGDGNPFPHSRRLSTLTSHVLQPSFGGASVRTCGHSYLSRER